MTSGCSPSRALSPLVLIVATGFLTVAAPLPVIPVFVNDTFSRSDITIGVLIGLQSVTTVLSRRRAGLLVDRRGPKPAVIRGLVACVAAGVSYVFASLVSGLPWAGLASLAIGRVILGVGESLLLTGAIAWGIARIGTGQAGKVMSWNGIAMYAALAAGAPLGSLIYTAGGADRFGFLLLGIAAAAVPLVALAVAARIPAITPLPARPMPVAAVFRAVWLYGLVLTLQMVGFGTISSFLSLSFAARGWTGAGTAFTAFGMAVIATRLIFGGLPDRLGGLRVAAVCLTTGCLGQMLLAAADAPSLAVLGSAITGVGCALAFPALGVEAMRQVPAGNRGVVIGVFSAFQDIAFGLTGPLAGVVAGLSGYPSIFTMGAGAAAAGLALLAIVSRRNNHEKDRHYRFGADGPPVVGHLSQERV